MHILGTFLVFTLTPGTVMCWTSESRWRDFDSSNLHSFNTSDLSSILNPPALPELAARLGLRADAHDVRTDDGYILTVFRLRGPGARRTRSPLLLLHGVMDSADTWLVRGALSPAAALVHAGRDVWLANARGNRYSRRHVALDPARDPAYWDFSFDEHALLDLPATADVVLAATGAPRLTLVGHSQGTTVTWALLAARPEYNDKIDVVVALAPVCYLRHIRPPLGVLIQLAPTIYAVLRALRVTNLFGDDSAETTLLRAVAQVPVLGYLAVGYGFVFALAGEDPAELGPEFLRTVILHFPTWTSVKNLFHYAQVARSNVFSRFDYGPAGNRAAYNSSAAPEYPLGRVSARVALLAAPNDKLAPLADVEALRRRLPNVVRYVINPRLTMNHIDFVWGATAPIYLYGYIFEVLESFS